MALILPLKFLSLIFVTIGFPRTAGRHMNVIDAGNENCVLCNEQRETISHLFFSCTSSWKVWNAVIQQCGFSMVLHNDP